ncbi:MAG: preprotein translocase subunit SecG [Eubacteriales bacterium]|nr:preprotein translocase subunit SecG [Eubacteriales bacterium]
MNNLIALLASASTVMTYILGGIAILLSLVISIAVALQPTKDEGLSGTIVGSGESFFGKSGGMTKEKWLSKLTLICSIILVVVVSVLTIVVISK